MIMKQLCLILCFLLLQISMHANELPFQGQEELKFDIHYKYGLVMLKAGTANYYLAEATYNNNKSFKTTVDFRTTSFFDKIFKMRDTLSAHIAENLNPLYHKRMIYEGNYHIAEELFFNQFGRDYSEVRVRRVSGPKVSFDTIVTSKDLGYDIVNILHFIRSLDYAQMRSPIDYVSTFFGKGNIKITIRNEGQTIVEKSETLKYNTYKIALDFTDNVFNESKNAIEIWMSDDENKIPIRVRAKLKIGAAEVHLVSWKNLKHPFSSEVIIPARNNLKK